MRCVLLVILSLAGVAHADQKASLAHYEQGKRAYAAASFETAIGEFQAAYAEFPAPEYLHDIAQAYRRLDRSCEALDYFERYLAAKPDAKNKDEVTASITALRPKCTPASPPPQPTVANEPVAATASEPVASAPVASAPPPTAVAASTTLVTRASEPARSPYTLAASAGVSLLGAGPVAMPPVGRIAVAARYRLGGPADLHVGLGASLARLPYDDIGSGTAWLVGPAAVVDASTALRPRLAVVGGASLGLTIVTGLAAGNPFTTGGMASGAIATAELRGELGIAWQASDRLTVRVFPVGYQWIPLRAPVASDVGSLRGFTMSGGVVVGW